MAEARNTIASLSGFPAAVGPLNLDVKVGDIVLLRGGNGSGKTSLLRSLAGLAAPLRASQARLGDADPGTLPAAELARQVHLALQDPAETLAGLTVAGEFRLRGLALATDLRDLANRDVATLSSGQARRVGLSLVTTSSAPLLLLDEPADGLDLEGRAALIAAVRTQAARGAVVAADHTGLLAPWATRVLDLSSMAVEVERELPAHGEPGLVLASAACSVKRGAITVQLPALRLGPGFHVVHGPNASGKSTLLLQLAGLAGIGCTVSGEPAVPGANVQLLLPRAADLFSCDDVASELSNIPADWRSPFVPDSLLPRHPLSLSAGEAQRVALAKCLGRAAAVYLLDEPESHLDAAGRAALMAALARRLSEGACILAATHDARLQACAQSRIAMRAP